MVHSSPWLGFARDNKRTNFRDSENKTQWMNIPKKQKSPIKSLKIFPSIFHSSIKKFLNKKERGKVEKERDLQV